MDSDAEHAPSILQRMSVGDAEIEYSERGEGESVMLVHAGVFSDWFLPLSESRTLDGLHVVRARRAGYGSHSPGSHLTIHDHAYHIGALADRLGIEKIHWVGHSSSCQMGLALAIGRPELVQSLVLIEPAAGGGFSVPASEQLAHHFAGPAMQAFAVGDVDTAFDTFMRGVCGDAHRRVIEDRLGPEAYARAVRESAFFFRDEMPAVLESTFGAAEAARVRQPVLLVEGEDSARLGPLSRQITALAGTLLPHAETVTIAGVNHQMPLQDPDAVGRVIANWVRRHPSATA